MLLLISLLLMLFILIVVTVLAISIGGSIAVVLFGDVIVCIFIIVWIIKRLIERKKKK